MRWLRAGEVPTLGNWFRAAGYDTHYDGKWHITHADLIDHATGEPLPTNMARKYMSGKMLCASFMGSVAELTGGDTTIAFWAEKEDASVKQVSKMDEMIEEISMPELKVYEGTGADERVFNLLNKTVGAELGAFDINQTAAAPLLYGMMGDEAVEKALDFAAVPMDEENAKKYLDSLPKEALIPLLSTLSRSCSGRRDELNKLVHKVYYGRHALSS